MFEGGYKNKQKIIAPNKGYGVLVKPTPMYEWPADHPGRMGEQDAKRPTSPCYGCAFTFNENKPSCMTGEYPDTENCTNTYYNKILARQRAAREAQLAKEEKT
ncbi:MAG: hypothetical protein FWC16_09710 [Defluviitaleaceae bacterium]|nr:hypothetical protein [Defluviitaleaceae bacterium]MCL2275189.1 hypothetical protein [Defluviitaleaceae bacterium]